MTTNCTIRSVQTPRRDALGRKTLPESASIAVRAFIDSPTRAQSLTLGAALVDVTAVLYIPANMMGIPGEDDRLTIGLDHEQSARQFTVAKAMPMRHGEDTDHDVVFLRRPA